MNPIESTQLRISAHRLRVESARYGRNRLERSDRTCQICKKNVIEDEFHFVIECDKYKDLRCIYIPRYYTHRPNMLKFFELIDCKNALC